MAKLNSGASEEWTMPASTSDNRCITVKPHEHHLIWKSCWTEHTLKSFKSNANKT